MPSLVVAVTMLFHLESFCFRYMYMNKVIDLKLRRKYDFI